ncbi:NAD-binding protein [Rhodococcus qingshengii]|uniref:2,6-dihydroxypyridine 3-hydroxylase n=1 Tax=Rhodococcus qingshengii TaxID=334542 RepID=A0A2A5J1Q7_RHOSG|nr:NAD-binding protein [Rhodococcus qingshengii]PCK23167.1 2,6-dihydroxypyridine 3-hydroxylase [Rhodococcus qingshengii]
MSMPKVAVIGGSIGGLTAANLLRDIGCEVDVYERSPRLLSGFGTGIVVQPELVRYLLERTGTTLEDLSVPSSSMRYYDAATGLLKDEVSASWRFTAYNAVYRKLLDAYGTDRYHLEQRLAGIDRTSAGPVAKFADGSTVAADLIVCADGGGSGARSVLLGVEPAYAGYVTWRGMVDRDDVSEETWDFFQDAFSYGLLEDSHIIAYPIPQVSADGRLTGRHRLNFQWYWNVAEGPDLDHLMTDNTGRRSPVSVHHAMLTKENLTSLRVRADDQLARPFRELISAAPEPFVTVVADADVEQMAFDNVVLIGDAAITPRPHAAAGAAKAACDAWNLADHLEKAEGNVIEALAAWEPDQLAVGHAYLAKVRGMAKALQHGGDFSPGRPEYRFGLPVSARALTEPQSRL